MFLIKSVCASVCMQTSDERFMHGKSGNPVCVGVKTPSESRQSDV